MFKINWNIKNTFFPQKYDCIISKMVKNDVMMMIV